jgi:ethanolaminephosphotransferase
MERNLIPFCSWEEYHTGTLYLSAFSGPVEGILLICGMYFITAAKTPAFWQTPVIDFLPILAHKFQSLVGVGIGHGVEDVAEKLHGGLSQLGWLKGVSVVESFLYFGAFGLAGNIANA